MLPSRRLLFCCAPWLVLLAAPALGHESALPIGGDALRVEAPSGPSSRSVRFDTTGQAFLNNLSHDLTEDGAWLLVLGVGPNAGHSGRIELDPAGWSASLDGYTYSDLQGLSGGVTEAVLEPGSVQFAASGADWPWDPAGPQNSVWVYFGFGEEVFCAEFGGTVLSNQVGSFIAENAAAPAACPAATCGNGEREFGEACDDGNHVEDDGCTSTCEIGVCVGEEFDSTFEAIQELVFEQQGCTNGLCHGSSPGAGELQLTSELAYDNLIDVPSTGSAYDLVEPRQPIESALWLKLLKASDPDATDIPGAAMPTGLPPIPEDLGEAVRRWVEAGAPETGTVALTQSLLGGCFPDPVPIAVAPLPAPEPSEGIQLTLPAYSLAPQTESEVCVATYYDLRGTVPDDVLDATGEFFFVSESEIRSDPHSHHMIAFHSGLYAEDVADPSYGVWTCEGGEFDDDGCDPLDLDGCGTGTCHSEVRDSLVCFNFGAPGGANGADRGGDLTGPYGNSPGLFTRIPTHGIIYWNSHAFNLTDVELELHSWRNFYFASSAEREREEERFQDIQQIYIATGQPPYTIQSYCADHVFEQGTRLISLNSHTHQRGEVFWVTNPDGETIYESFVYSDPLTITYDPPLSFDSPDPEERTLEYCATFNNGIDQDGLPDPNTVRKRSTTPQNRVFPLCRPIACTEGLVGSLCDGILDDASCDTFADADDGFCDACPITSGVTTEDEMFVLLGSTFTVPEPSAGLLAVLGLITLGVMRQTRRAP